MFVQRCSLPSQYQQCHSRSSDFPEGYFNETHCKKKNVFKSTVLTGHLLMLLVAAEPEFTLFFNTPPDWSGGLL